MKDLLIYTSNYDSDPSKIRYLRDSCKHFGVEIGTYGEGIPWPGYIAGKITNCIPFLQGRSEPYVLLSDGADSLMLRDPSGLMEAYQSFGKPIVISGERDCFPQRELASYFQPTESGYSFPNAGGIMGERVAMITALQFMDHQYDEGEDQARWIRLMVDNPSSIVIDSNCQIFQTMSGGAGRHIIFESNPLLSRNIRTGTAPYFLHFNGRAEGIEEVYGNVCGK